ncbi:MAG: ankyrin repeat domain-containing protein [Pseudomonadota bacterium]|nr:ankyrin repeat domain-containing protein [Pseudomonadota bacterium]
MSKGLCIFLPALVIGCSAFVFANRVGAGVREDSLFLTGARSQQLTIVRASLEQGAYVNSRDELAGIPLMWSAFHGPLAIMEVLIVRGATVNVGDKMGQAALVWVAITGREVGVEAPLGAEADPSIRDANGMYAAERAAQEGHNLLSQSLKT